MHAPIRDKKKCRTRMETLKASYKACKQQKKSGAGASIWEYLVIMDRILEQNPKTRGIPGVVDANKMEAEQSMNKDLNEPSVKMEDLNQPRMSEEHAILGQKVKGKRKRKQREEYIDVQLNPFEKAYLASISKFHEEHITLEKRKMAIMEDIRNYICLGVGIKRNVNGDDDEDSSSQLDPEEITEDFWIKKYQLTWAKKI